MAEVTLDIEECRKGMLPPVCVRCGRHAPRTKSVNYFWEPRWVLFFYIGGLVLYWIVASGLRKKTTIHWPVCREHDGFWGWYFVLLGGWFFVFMVLLIFGIAVTQNPQFKPIGLGMCGGAVLGFIVCTGVREVIIRKMIHPVEITEYEVTMQKVHPEFVAALEEDREAEERAYQARRRRRRSRGRRDDRE
ncbi:MAG: hypothetical protein ACRC8S_17220 [Fimbriiglobus sp.]